MGRKMKQSTADAQHAALVANANVFDPNDPLLQQEQMVQKRLQIPDAEWSPEERLKLARSLQAVQVELFDEKSLLFERDEEELTPMNLPSYVERLIERSNAIADLAITCSSAWSFDFLTVFIADMGRVFDFGDSGWKHNFVLVMHHLTAAQDNQDMVALADLCSCELPALLRALLKINHLRVTTNYSK